MTVICVQFFLLRAAHLCLLAALNLTGLGRTRSCLESSGPHLWKMFPRWYRIEKGGVCSTFTCCMTPIVSSIQGHVESMTYSMWMTVFLVRLVQEGN